MEKKEMQIKIRSLFSVCLLEQIQKADNTESR